MEEEEHVVKFLARTEACALNKRESATTTMSDGEMRACPNNTFHYIGTLRTLVNRLLIVNVAKEKTCL